MVVTHRKTDQRHIGGCEAQKDRTKTSLRLSSIERQIKDLLMVVKHRKMDQRLVEGCQAQKDRPKTS